MFKTELHVHTSPVSRCGKVGAEQMVNQFINCGYDTIVITNHMSPTLLKHVVPHLTDWKEIIDFYLADYHLAKKIAGDKMNVLLGMEFRTNHNINDYLVYGIDEQFLYDTGNIFDKEIKDVIPVIHDAGGIVIQAHPFRNDMTVVGPSLLDGIEAYNFAAKHDSRNDIAVLWAKKYDLLATCGQDYHNTEYIIGAGILTDTEIKDEKQLVNILKSRNFKMTDGSKILT